MLDHEERQELDFKEFCETVRRLLTDKFHNGYRVELNGVTKNNAIRLEGVVILQKNEKVAPNIYLNSYYLGYLNGLSLEEIIEDISEEYYNTRVEGDVETITENFEFEKIESNIVYRLINYDKNKRLLSEIPHTRYLDLAVTFHCLVKSNEDGIGTIRITNQHLKMWNVTIEELIQAAKLNTPKLFPPIVQSMRKVVEKLMKEELSSTNELLYSLIDEKENQIENYNDENLECEFAQDDFMLVISNQKNINGASCMIYPDLLKMISEKLNADLYILPSSIHELIIIKNDYTNNKKVLKEMVKEVNLTQVPLEDVLSDSVYFYSRTRLALTLV